MEKKALLIIDLQVGLESAEKKLFQLERVLNEVNDRIAVYRKENRPIIFIQHEDEELIPDSHAWHLFPELHAEEKDYYISKTHANSFFHTNLTSLLETLGVTQLEICGAQTEYCVDTTIRMAHGLGYNCFMKKGLTTTLNNSRLKASEIIQHHEAIWNLRFLTFFSE
ncbi:cysteine hydrolase family protein [Enterococcus sp. CWB-B31]|uniref:cysteine hydrolase family protein n=1 Tax=Enterococcus sp. CWB-B31 TaxID=2885159 RepID=UPI001E2F1432|nr:cysteine hydrolase family protein [Enterococcus sp. CWB-B31]MCB5955644.1 cysteine hydrolase [Enterococcus sp. CWB-B31]